MKGRRPTSENVVPLKSEEGEGVNFEARGRARANELKPEGMSFTASAIWDTIAPPLCDPRRNRINEAHVFMLGFLCETIDRHQRLRVDLSDNGETYTVKSRNGDQQKSRPEVGQFNETWRQVRGLANEFGMTPASERAVKSSGQMGLNFDDNGDDFD